MRQVILSQWRERKMGVTWQDLGALTTVRAREFWICLCSVACIRELGQLYFLLFYIICISVRLHVSCLCVYWPCCLIQIKWWWCWWWISWTLLSMHHYRRLTVDLLLSVCNRPIGAVSTTAVSQSAVRITATELNLRVASMSNGLAAWRAISWPWGVIIQQQRWSLEVRRGLGFSSGLCDRTIHVGWQYIS